MLIIPIEQNLDSNHPPVATLLLILINVFVFFGYQQSNDAEILQSSSEYYEQNKLFKYEKNVYPTYLQEKHPDKIEEFKNLDESYQQVWIIQDREFARFLEFEYFTNNVTDIRWMDARSELDKMIAKLSYYKFGLIPAELSIVGIFTSMFLHGDIVHLLGNMVFLFIYGFSLEIALGRLWYLGCYLASGIAGSLLTWAGSPDSLVPTVGASGAIFGLLGMYLGLYGFKRIKFFFTIGFYANQFRAPALVLLPYWGLIELYGQLAQTSHIAHFAHLGGLLGGVIIVATAKDRLIPINRDYVENIDVDDPFNKQYDSFLRSLESFNFAQAKKQLTTLMSQKPSDFRLLVHCFDLAKLQPKSKIFEDTANRIFSKKNLFSTDAPTISRIALEYEKLSEEQSAFTAPIRINLIDIFLGADQLHDAENQVDNLRDDPQAQKKMPEILFRMTNYLASRNHLRQSRRYAEELLEKFPDSELALQVKSLNLG